MDYLRRAASTSARTIRDIWEAAKEPKGENGAGGLSDTATLPTYHRTMAKLVRQGQLEEHGTHADGAALYRAVAQLSPLSTYTLTDLNAVLWELSAVDAMSEYLDAVDYYESRAQDVLKKAALRLLKEDPRELILVMLRDRSMEIEENIGILQDPVANDRAHRAQTRKQLEDLRYFVNSELGISPTVWSLPTFDQVEKGLTKYTQPDWELVKDALTEHVFGTSFLE